MVQKYDTAKADPSPDGRRFDQTTDRPRGRTEVVRAIYSAMHRLYAEKGDLSIREIADEAHINHSLIGHYFGSKDALLLAFLVHERESIAADLIDQDDSVEGFAQVAASSFEYKGYFRAVALWGAQGPDESALPTTFLVAAQMLRMLESGVEHADVSLEGVRRNTIAALTLAMLIGWQSSSGWLSRAFEIGGDDERSTAEIVALARWIGAQAADAQR